jgi:glycosyltransferase involved in cell wall biosynthesis
MVQPNARCDGLPVLSAQLQFERSRRDLTGPDPEPESLELSIVMPCLNEAETIAVCIQKAQAFLKRADVRGEVVIADNGSTDGSREIAKAHGARTVSVPRKGYGAALMGGIMAAQGRYIVIGDADDSYDFSSLDAFLMHLRDGADLVIGNRFLGGIGPNAMPFLHRYLGNPVLSFLGRLFFRVSAGDFHCGLRAFRADSVRKLALRTAGMEFASEMVVRAALAQLKIAEVPVALKRDGRSRPPHLNTWSDGWRHLKFLLMYSPRWLFMIPGLCFVVFGTFLAAILSFGPFHLENNVVLDLNSFVAACFMIIVGIQLITFSGIARYYATVTGFLPDSRRARALVEHVTTDRLVCLAAAFIILGVVLFGSAMSTWAHSGFGPIATPIAPRSAAAGLTAIVIGLQTFFSAFFLGVLTIPTQRPAPASGSPDY